MQSQADHTGRASTGRGRAYPTTPEQAARIVAMRRNGATYAAIAAAEDCSKGRINRALARVGMVTPHKRRRVVAERPVRQDIVTTRRLSWCGCSSSVRYAEVALPRVSFLEVA